MGTINLWRLMYNWEDPKRDWYTVVHSPIAWEAWEGVFLCDGEYDRKMRHHQSHEARYSDQRIERSRQPHLNFLQSMYHFIYDNTSK